MCKAPISVALLAALLLVTATAGNRVLAADP
jgi:hypothetical protein